MTNRLATTAVAALVFFAGCEPEKEVTPVTTTTTAPTPTTLAPVIEPDGTIKGPEVYEPLPDDLCSAVEGHEPDDFEEFCDDL